MSVIRRIQIGENHKSAEVLNRPTDDIQTLSGLTLGATFGGFARLTQFDVRTYGATGNGTTDDTAFIRLAVTAASVAGGVVFFPPGIYLVTDTITIAAVGVRVMGAGLRASFVLFNPSSARVCFDWINANSAQTLSNCGLSDIGATSSNAVQKTWCRLTDVSDFNEDRVCVYASWTSTAKDSIGYEHRGRELYHTRNYTNFADRPYVFSQNPRDGGSLIDCDSYTFENGYVRAATTQYAFYFDPTLRSVQSPKFDGGTIVGGLGGFQWNGSGATADSPGWLIKDWRSEQMTGSSGWFVDFSRDANSILDPQFINIAPNTTQNGFRLRRTTHPYFNTIRWPDVVGSSKVFDVDATVTKIFWENLWSQTGGAATLTGQTQVWALTRINSVDLSLPISAFYDTATNGAMVVGNIMKWNASSRIMLPSDALLIVDSTNSTVIATWQTTGRLDLTNGVKIGAGTSITSQISGSKTFDWASIAAGAQATTTVTVTGAVLGDCVTCSMTVDLQGMQLTGYVSAADTVTTVMRNGTAVAIDLASGTLRAAAWRHL